jgi:hypothetical protein
MSDIHSGNTSLLIGTGLASPKNNKHTLESPSPYSNLQGDYKKVPMPFFDGISQS